MENAKLSRPVIQRQKKVGGAETDGRKKLTRIRTRGSSDRGSPVGGRREKVNKGANSRGKISSLTLWQRKKKKNGSNERKGAGKNMPWERTRQTFKHGCEMTELNLRDAPPRRPDAFHLQFLEDRKNEKN